MGFYIQCHQCRGTCLESAYIEDGYNNDKEIVLKIIGEQLIELKCNSCETSITVVDGDIT